MDKYDKGAMLVGEGPLTKDLINITDTDFKRVSAVSIGIVFVIILLLFKSVTIPVILVGVIEFAIFVNMGIPFYTGTKLPFCGINRNRYDPAWRDCGLCDPDDHQISEREKPRRRQI